jgi:type I restriction enzyme S subunit
MNRQESEIGTCPSHWVITKLKEVAELKHGYQFRTSDFTESGVKIFKITQIQSNGSINLESCSFIDIDRLENFKNNLIKYGDILMALTGATIGKIARFNSTEIVLQNYRVGNFIPHDENILNKDYFYYFLTTDKIYYQIIANQNQSAQENVGKEDIHNMLIFLPPLPEQKAIASVLSSLDDKIDLLHQQNQTLEALAETLFRQWFIEEAKEDWEEVELYDFIDFLEGPGLRNWQYTDHGTRFVNIRLINNGEVDIKKSNFVSDEEANGRYSHFLLKEKDIIVSTSGTLGKSAIIRDYHLPLMLNTSVIRFRPKDNINYSFIYQYLQSDIFLNHLENTASGSVQLNFGPTHLKQMKMVLPDELTLGKYRLGVDPLYEKLNLNYKKIQTLTQMRETLLPKLMSGEVRVNL